MTDYEVKNVWDIFDLLRQNKMGIRILSLENVIGWYMQVQKYNDDSVYDFNISEKIPTIKMIKEIIESINHIQKEKEKFGKKWTNQKYSRWRKDIYGLVGNN